MAARACRRRPNWLRRMPECQTPRSGVSFSYADIFLSDPHAADQEKISRKAADNRTLIGVRSVYRTNHGSFGRQGRLRAMARATEPSKLLVPMAAGDMTLPWT